MLRLGRLTEACQMLLDGFEDQPSAHTLAERTEALMADYGRLLDFFSQGTQDPHREQLYDGLMECGWQLADDYLDWSSPVDETIKGQDLGVLLAQLKQDYYDDEKLADVFDKIVDSHQLGNRDRKLMHQALLDDAIPEEIRGCLLSAVMLNLCEWFDAKTVENLYTYTLDDQPLLLRMQAWIALMLVALIHENRVKLQPRLMEQYQFMCEDNSQLLFTIQMAMLQSSEGDNIKALSDQLKHPDEDDEGQRIEALKKFIKQLREGYDTTYESFVSCSKHPFFAAPRNRHHWFLKLTPELTYVKKIMETSPKAQAWCNMVASSLVQCETDKHITMLSVAESHPEVMDLIVSKLDSMGLTPTQAMMQDPRNVINNYLHDLFRYCTLHPSGKWMRNSPFDFPMDFFQNACLESVMKKKDRKKKVLDFYYLHEHWDSVRFHCMKVLKKGEDKESRLRMAYASLKMGLTEFVEEISQCFQRYPDELWVVRQLSDRYHSSKLYPQEEDLLRKAIGLKPNETSLQSRLGKCLTAQGKYSEALELLYKADMTKEGQLRIQRELARTLFGMKDAARAERYIRLVLNRSEPTWEDWMLGGRIALLGQDIKLALERYCFALQVMEEPVEVFKTERDTLLNAGISLKTYYLMAELISRQTGSSEE